MPGRGRDERTDDGDRPATGGDVRVRVKPSAIAASTAVRELVGEWGRTITFSSRGVAETVATDLSDRGTGQVWIQGAPESDLDAYLVGRERAPGEPVERDGNRFTCRVSGNQYGALGETLVTGPGRSPALRTWICEDLPVTDDALADVVFETDSRPPPVFVPDETDSDGPRHRWIPDYRVLARVSGEDRPIREYWCEVKTGDGALERSQAAAMATLDGDRRVLVLTVDVSDLPETYAVRVSPFEDEG